MTAFASNHPLPPLPAGWQGPALPERSGDAGARARVRSGARQPGSPGRAVDDNARGAAAARGGSRDPNALSPQRSANRCAVEGSSRARVAAIPEEQDGTVELAGHLKSDTDQADLVARIKAVPGVATVGTSGLIVGGDHYCSVFSTLARPGMTRIGEQETSPGLIGNPAQSAVLRLTKGMPIELQSKTPDFPAFVYVDYYSSDGNVFHLLPSRDFGRETFPPGTQLRIGHPGDPGPQPRVAPPFGLDMVVVLDSSMRLFDTERPAAEPAETYLAALKAAVDRAVDSGSAKLAYEYQLVFTSEIGGQ